MTEILHTGTLHGVGVFPFPAGLLLIPGDDPSASDVRTALNGGRLPDPWPETLGGHALAYQGDLTGALATLTGDDPVTRYNRWLLDPESDDAVEVRSGLPAELAPLVDVVAYSIGIGDSPPRDSADPTADASGKRSIPGEIEALVLATQATGHMEAGAIKETLDLLARAVEVAQGSPALAATLLGNIGTLRHENGGDRDLARTELAEAAEALTGMDLPVARAELLYQLGSIAHEEAASGRGDSQLQLKLAMGHYYDALQLVTEQTEPYLWASIQMNLAAAHLASPMTTASDQLRLGVATQALRACRRVFTHAEHPGPWSTATLNLANALVYTPSTHQGDNLVEAVELYEEVLESGVRDRDPLGRARVLANQGNALAHLGIFEEARGKLVEARFVFEEHLDHDGAHTVRGLLDEIAKAQLGDHDDAMADLARQADQMSRMPTSDAAYSSGMGVRLLSGDVVPAPKPRVTVLPRADTLEPANPGAEQ